MVSDHSSIAFEYMLLDRPLVVIDRPALIEQARINPDKVRQLRRAAAVSREPAEVVQAVLDSIQQPDRLSVERIRTAGDLFHRPGTATNRALAHIYRILDLPLAAETAAAVNAALEPAGVC
jgi:CDP-glycerol glycerophosphotransferase (TagB/SpsB family)